jgi:succinoglycan biosynthesis protein ExoA
MAPFISVIMPVRNEAAHIAGTLEQLLAQQYDPKRFEILVVDGRSTDTTVDTVRGIMRAHPQVQLLDNPRRLSSAARNIGVQHARGDYIVIVDGHCEIRSRKYFNDVVSAFDKWYVDCLGRPQPLDVNGASHLQRAIAAARSSRLGHHPASHIYSSAGGLVKPQSVAIAYRTEVFERVGLFDERFDACEDVEFNHRVDRAGMRCRLVPELAVHYRPRDTLSGLFHQMQRYGRGRIRLQCKHPDTFSVAVFLPAVFFVGLTFLPLVGLTAAAGLIALAYTLIIATAGVLHGVLNGARRAAVLLPVVIVTIHAGAASGVITELCATALRWVVPRRQRWSVLDRTVSR